MPGIEDLTNIMVTGGRNDIPGGPPPLPMGGPPMGGPPMGGPPMGGLPMGGPAAAETLMANADMLQGDMQRPPMEGGGGIEQDAGALAEAVFTRTQGDINAALAILDGATQILIGSGQQGLPIQQEQPLMAAHGRPILMDRDSNQLGRTLSDRDLLAEAGTDPADTLRLLLGQEGRELSDADLQQFASLAAYAPRDLSDADIKFIRDLIGRTMSDRDIGRTPSDRDMKVGKPGYNRRSKTLSDRDYTPDKTDEFYDELYRRRIS